VNDDMKTLIARLANLPEWVALESYVNEKRDEKIHLLIRGNLSRDDYLSTAGEIRGLETLLNAPRMPVPRRSATITSRH